MTEQTRNEVDRSGQKVGMWTEVDSHGVVVVGEYAEGKRQGVWRHYFADESVRSPQANYHASAQDVKVVNSSNTCW